MKTLIHTFCAVVIAVGLQACKLDAGGFPLDVTTLREINSGSIEFEKKHGRIFVRVIDKYRDCHIHVFNHEGMTKAEALALLKEKQKELKTKESEQIHVR